MSKLTVVIADDHALMLRGIRRALETADDIEVVGEAQTGVQALELIRQHEPDVVLLDTRMPVMDGGAVLDVLREKHPKVKVLVMSVSNDSDHISRALRRGACGYIVKSVNPVDLPAAVRQAWEGTVFNVVGTGPGDTQANAKEAGLTERESAILKSVSRGLPNRQIAAELFVTEQTVKFHLTNIYRKLGVVNRTDAVRFAYQNRLLDTPTRDLG